LELKNLHPLALLLEACFKFKLLKEELK